MRKIKFRGYRVNDTAWAYGDLVHLKGDSGAIETFIQDDGVPLLVDPESVGQLTGIRDKKGRCIYEGDIVRHDENGKCYAIAYDTEVPQFCFADNSDLFKFLNHPELLEVVGNVHDNPELLIQDEPVYSHWRATIKEVGNDHILTPELWGYYDLQQAKRFFGLDEADVEWYKIEDYNPDEDDRRDKEEAGVQHQPAEEKRGAGVEV